MEHVSWRGGAVRQRVMCGVDASSVEDRQEAGGDVGQQLKGTCEEGPTIFTCVRAMPLAWA